MPPPPMLPDPATPKVIAPVPSALMLKLLSWMLPLFAVVVRVTAPLEFILPFKVMELFAEKTKLLKVEPSGNKVHAPVLVTLAVPAVPTSMLTLVPLVEIGPMFPDVELNSIKPLLDTTPVV
jgi:hypothetical protein